MSVKFDRARRIAALAGVICVSGACGGEIDANPTASSRRDESSGARGASAVGTFDLGGVRARLRYENINGQRVYDGDILLPASEEERAGVDPSTLSVGRTASSYLWPNNTVVYAFDPALQSARRTRVLAAMAHWSATTQMRFVEVSYLTPLSVSHVYIQPSDDGCNSNVGHLGGRQEINVTDWCTEGNLIHEIGHTVGFWHEHTRSDRDAHVIYDEGCVTGVVPEPGATLEDLLEGPPIANFALQPPGGEYGLYDFSSVMHYSSLAFADATPTVLCDSVNGYTLWRRSSAPGTEDAVTYQREGLSFIDRQGVAEMTSEGFGRAVTSGDFNGDGYIDAAVGAPRRGDLRDGRVRIFLGGATGLTRSIELYQTTGGESEDRYGYSLAAGDFNGDGIKDLAVGVPGEDARAGRVMIYRGQRNNLSPLVFQASIATTAAGAPTAGDRFGFSLATGDIDNDGDDELAVGAPGDGTVSAPSSGSVALYRGGAAWLTSWSVVAQTGVDLEAGDNFGASLALGDIDNDGHDDLLVGAPHERYGTNEESGVVSLYRGGATVTPWRTLFPQIGATTYAAWDLLFGFSVSAGDYNGDGYTDIAVGAPGATVDGARWAGRAFVYLGAALGPAILASFTLTQDTPSMGAAFGFSLASGRFDAGLQRDLAVGAPGGDPTADIASGQVVVFSGRAASPQLTRTTTLNQTRASEVDEAGDHFGAAVDFGDYDNDGDTDLLAAADAEVWANITQGRGYTFRATSGALNGWSSVGP